MLRIMLIALTTLAGAATADTATTANPITILETTLYPEVNFVEVGQHITFHNSGTSTRTVEATDDSWTSGPLAPSQSFTLLITEGMTLGFNLSEANDATGSFVILTLDGIPSPIGTGDDGIIDQEG